MTAKNRGAAKPPFLNSKTEGRIRELNAEGKSVRAMASEFGVDPSTVSRAMKRLGLAATNPALKAAEEAKALRVMMTRTELAKKRQELHGEVLMFAEKTLAKYKGSKIPTYIKGDRGQQVKVEVPFEEIPFEELKFVIESISRAIVNFDTSENSLLMSEAGEARAKSVLELLSANLATSPVTSDNEATLKDNVLSMDEAIAECEAFDAANASKTD